jgi:hypothetical protein
MLSPDGTAVAFSAKDANGKHMLWIRPLTRSLPGPWRERREGLVRSGRRTAGSSGSLPMGS